MKDRAHSYDLWSSVDATTKAHPSLKRKAKKPLPHPGQSYNPRPEDHARLLNKVAKLEMKFQKKARGCKVKIAPDELRRGEVQLDEDSDGFSTDDAYGEYEDKDFQVILKDHTVREKRKTPQQRMRQLKDKMQRKAAKLRRAKNIKLSKFDGLKKLVKQLDEKDKELGMKKKRHKNLKNERLSQKLELSDPIYCLSKELPSNLRQIRCPMNAVVREQLESFQKRLMVEPSRIQTSLRRYKKKKFEKQGDPDQFDHFKGGNEEMDDVVEGIDDGAAVESDEEKTLEFV